MKRIWKVSVLVCSFVLYIGIISSILIEDNSTAYASIQTPAVKHSATLKWKAPAKPYSGFVVYRATNSCSNSFSTIASLGIVSTYTDNSVSSNTTYCYKLKTLCNSCSPALSNYSSTASVKIPK